MSDEKMPYEGAIEQTAKTAGKALDLVKDAAGPISDIYGIIIGDRISTARHRRLDEMMRKTRTILKERDLAETAEVPEQIAIPLLEAAQREPRDEMQELWARLLANAMDPARRADVRPEFVATLEGLQPLDVLILENLSRGASGSAATAESAGKAISQRESAAAVSFEQLVLKRCAREHIQSPGHFSISPFGAELVFACRP